MKEVTGITTVQYFEKDQFIGERTLACGSVSVDGKSFSAYWPHIAYFCPSCGELWGREVYQHDFKYTPYVKSSWAMEVRRCVECGDGTFLTERNLDGCSKDLLTREFLALLARSGL
jgi:hypothetical protein